MRHLLEAAALSHELRQRLELMRRLLGDRWPAVSAEWREILTKWMAARNAGLMPTALFLAQNAFHAGPIAASQTSLVLVDPLVSLIIGISLYGDDLRTSGAYGPLEALSLLVMFVGAAELARSPLVAGIRERDGGYSEWLAARSPGGQGPETPDAEP